jgi:hypothetical protein
VKLSKVYFHFILIPIIMQVLISYSQAAIAGETRINNSKNIIASHKRVGNTKRTVLKDAKGKILLTLRTTRKGIDVFSPENHVRN